MLMTNIEKLPENHKDSIQEIPSNIFKNDTGGSRTVFLEHMFKGTMTEGYMLSGVRVGESLEMKGMNTAYEGKKPGIITSPIHGIRKLPDDSYVISTKNSLYRLVLAPPQGLNSELAKNDYMEATRLSREQLATIKQLLNR